MFNIKTKVETNIDLDKYFNTLITGATKIQSFIDANAPQLSNALTEMIIYEVYKMHPIGEFMSARTAVDSNLRKGSIDLDIHGLPENEVDDEYTEKWKERTSKPVGQWYLWEFHEFGGNTKNVVMPVDKYPMHFEGSDFTEVYTYKRQGAYVTKYVGEVRFIINSMKKQIDDFLRACIELLANEELVNQIEEASGGEIKPAIPPRVVRNYQTEHQRQNEIAQAQGFKNRYERRKIRAQSVLSIGGNKSRIIRSQ